VSAIIFNYVLALALGALVAAAELVSRYKDAPTRAIGSGPGLTYLAVNGLGSVAVLALITSLGVDFGGLQGGALTTTQILTAGIGSIAFFRTSLFNVTLRDTSIGVGPNVILVVILTALDRGVDRKRARGRSEAVAAIMEGFDFSAGAYALQKYCLTGLMQNPTDDDTKAVGTLISDLQDKLNDNIPGQVKSYILGLNLMNIVGRDVLKDAVARVKPHIAPPIASGSQGIAGPPPGKHITPPAERATGKVGGDGSR
jgi:hypothetical protein